MSDESISKSKVRLQVPTGSAVAVLQRLRAQQHDGDDSAATSTATTTSSSGTLGANTASSAIGATLTSQNATSVTATDSPAGIARDRFARSLATVGNAIDKGQKGSQMFVFGHRFGSYPLQRSLHECSIASKSAASQQGLASKDARNTFKGVVQSVFPGLPAEENGDHPDHLTLSAMSDNAEQNKINYASNRTAKKFFARGVEQVTTLTSEGTTSVSYEDQPIGDTGVATAVFNAFATPDAITMMSTGPGNRATLPWSNSDDDIQLQEDVFHGLLNVGKVTAESVENTASLVFNTALQDWLQTALSGLATMHSLAPPSVEPERRADSGEPVSVPEQALPLPADSQAPNLERRSSDADIDDAGDFGTDADAAVSVGSDSEAEGTNVTPVVERRSSDAVVDDAGNVGTDADAAGVVGFDSEADTTDVTPFLESTSSDADIDDAGVFSTDTDAAGVVVRTDTDAAVSVGSDSEAEGTNVTPVVERRSSDAVVDDAGNVGTDTDAVGVVGSDSEAESTDVTPVLERRSSGRISTEPAPEKNDFENVELITTDTDWFKLGDSNAVGATRDIAKGELVFQEILGVGTGIEHAVDYEHRFGAWATLSKGNNYVKLIGENEGPSMVYMVNHADRRMPKSSQHAGSGPNCRVTTTEVEGKGKDNSCVVRFFALRPITSGTELTWDYQDGEAPKDVQVPLFPAPTRPQRSRSNDKSKPARKAKSKTATTRRPPRNKTSGKKTDKFPTSFAYPCPNGHPPAAVLHNHDVPGDGNCFFSSAARQLNLDTFYLSAEDKQNFDSDPAVRAVRPNGEPWTQSRVRMLISSVMKDPKGERAVAIIKYAKEEWEMTKGGVLDDQPPLQSRMPTRSKPTDPIDHMTFEHLADSVAMNKAWVEPNVVVILQQFLQADLWYANCLRTEGGVNPSKWVYQPFDSSDWPTESSPKRRSMHLRKTAYYCERNKEQCEHFGSLEPAPTEVPWAAQSSADSTTNGSKRKANDLLDQERLEQLARELQDEEDKAKASAEARDRAFAREYQTLINTEEAMIAAEENVPAAEAPRMTRSAKRAASILIEAQDSQRRKQTNDK